MKISEMKALMKRYGLRLNKRLGQNFLANPLYLQRIVQAAELNEEDLVLEIGPGLGPLTEFLLEVARQVVAVEVDEGFTYVLQERFAERTNLLLYHEDILKTNLVKLLRAISKNEANHALPSETPSYKCVANIPYYITSAVIRHLLESDTQPEMIVLLIQKEVAQRIIALPGNLSLLAIGVQFYGEPEIIDFIPASAFYPPPKVDSAILRVRPYPEKRYAVGDTELFWQIVKAGFGQKRKQLKNSLQAGLPQFNSSQVTVVLEQAEIDIKRRAQTLMIEEWVKVYKAFEEINKTSDSF